MRTKRFIVETVVRGEFLRDQPETARRMAREALDRLASRPLKGPRGGTYQPIGPAYRYDDSNQASDSWMRDEHVFIARVDAKYVRPKRKE